MPYGYSDADHIFKQIKSTNTFYFNMKVECLIAANSSF